MFLFYHRRPFFYRNFFILSNLELLDEFIQILLKREKLPEKYHDHPLTGNWHGYRDCHIEPDWVLIYRIDDDALILLATRTGTHSDLFNK